ncbi:MAG TPA: hypothetical protein PLK94_10285 [Alphaproteobacteria bacterium]|nr:hypothetical protein [Alphaproteobacteria bacterium]HOO51661.1 hypothetical protein [Alphaproteobacteria bacterium]
MTDKHTRNSADSAGAITPIKAQVFASDKVRETFSAGVAALEHTGFDGKIVLVDPKDIQYDELRNSSIQGIMAGFRRALPPDDPSLGVIQNALEVNIYGDSSSDLINPQAVQNSVNNFAHLFHEMSAFSVPQLVPDIGQNLVVISVGEISDVRELYTKAMKLQGRDIPLHLSGTDSEYHTFSLLHELGHGLRNIELAAHNRNTAQNLVLTNETEADSIALDAARDLRERGLGGITEAFALDVLALRSYFAVAKEEVGFLPRDRAGHATAIALPDDPEHIHVQRVPLEHNIRIQREVPGQDIPESVEAHKGLHDKINAEIGRVFARDAIQMWRKMHNIDPESSKATGKISTNDLFPDDMKRSVFMYLTLGYIQEKGKFVDGNKVLDHLSQHDEEAFVQLGRVLRLSDHSPDLVYGAVMRLSSRTDLSELEKKYLDQYQRAAERLVPDLKNQPVAKHVAGYVYDDKALSREISLAQNSVDTGSKKLEAFSPPSPAVRDILDMSTPKK